MMGSVNYYGGEGVDYVMTLYNYYILCLVSIVLVSG